MDDTVASSLPPDMAEALRKELDPDEDVRWCGQPDAQRAFRRAIPMAVLITFALLTGSVLIALQGLSLFQQLHGIEPSIWRGDRTPSDVHATPLVTLAVALALCAVVAAWWPWRTCAVARRTVYGVTSSRVLVLVLNRHGNATVEAVVPRHPLVTRRVNRGGGSGDIDLFPHAGGERGPPGTALSLLFVDDAISVERLIRQTFDCRVLDAGASNLN